MPCYQVQTCSVELNNADVDLLHKALVNDGWTVYHTKGSQVINFNKNGVSGSYRKGKLEFQYTQGKKPDVDSIKREYSKAVIRQKAEEYSEQGFEMQEDGDEFVFTKTPGYGALYA